MGRPAAVAGDAETDPTDGGTTTPSVGLTNEFIDGMILKELQLDGLFDGVFDEAVEEMTELLSPNPGAPRMVFDEEVEEMTELLSPNPGAPENIDFEIPAFDLAGALEEFEKEQPPQAADSHSQPPQPLQTHRQNRQAFKRARVLEEAARAAPPPPPRFTPLHTNSILRDIAEEKAAKAK